jgi:two-component system, NtrC family, response regulator AtoC
MNRILLVDDEENMLTVLEMLFQNAGYGTKAVTSGLEAISLVSSGERFDVIISDLRMPDMDGIKLMKKLDDLGFDFPFVIITAYGTVEKAVDAMKLGAVDVITKPFKSEMILNVVARICRIESLQKENRILKDTESKADELIYSSAKMTEIASFVKKVGAAPTPVLITGESGTGKEVIARTLHRFYSNGDGRKPFVMVNCPAIPESLLESELFGYRRGAFTGADKDFKGRVELADGGILFFDEIGDLPLAIQPKLLRLIENKTYEPLGLALSRRTEVRIVCATNRNLKELVQKGLFREDLFYRINTITVSIPPLRDRPDDVPVLAEFFLKKYSGELYKPIIGFANGIMALLAAYSWPGNVRELRNVIERATVLSSTGWIERSDLPAEIAEACPPGILAASPSTGGANLLESTEKRLLAEALAAVNGNVSEAARRLGVSRNTMRYRMQKFGLQD